MKEKVRRGKESGKRVKAKRNKKKRETKSERKSRMKEVGEGDVK